MELKEISYDLMQRFQEEKTEFESIARMVDERNKQSTDRPKIDYVWFKDISYVKIFETQFGFDIDNPWGTDNMDPKVFEWWLKPYLRKLNPYEHRGMFMYDRFYRKYPIDTIIESRKNDEVSMEIWYTKANREVAVLDIWLAIACNQTLYHNMTKLVSRI